MPTHPFLLVMNVVLNSNGTGTMTYAVPPAEDLYIRDLAFVSSGAFSITNIRNSNGRIYSNTSTNNPIVSTMLANGNTNVQRFSEFDEPLVIMGSESIIIDFADTSGASNTVRVLMNCTRNLKV